MADGVVGIPGWVSFLHAIALHGVHQGEAEATRFQWEHYYASWSIDAKPSRPTRIAAVLSGVASHVWARMRGGRSTAIPAGVFFLFAAASEASLGFTDPDLLPLWTYVALTSSLLFVGVSLLSSPLLTGHKRLVGALTFNAVVMMAILPFITLNYFFDYVLLAGFILFVVGSLQMALSFALALRKEPSLHLGGVATLAAAALLIGIGNAGWTRIAEGPGYVLSCVASSLVAVIAGYFVSRMRENDLTDDQR